MGNISRGQKVHNRSNFIDDIQVKQIGRWIVDTFQTEITNNSSREGHYWVDAFFSNERAKIA